MGVGAHELLTEPSPKPSASAPDERSDSRLRWRRRPGLRAGIRIAAFIAPAIAATAAAVAFSRLIDYPADLPGAVIWWIVFIGAVVAAWTLTAELLERALPLATLMDLTLVFPDAAPSRFAILRRNVDRRHLERDLRRLRERSDPESAPSAQLILELAVAMSIHDSRTRTHSERVRMFTDLVAHELRLHQRDADRLRWAALLHDIGKLAVAPDILNKPELPDDDELESLRSHPLEGYRMIAPLHKWLGAWAATVRDHHERFDGTGYPGGLRGRAISLGGRIVAVTDSYEAMTAGRPYRRPLSVNAAREELVRRSGTHFDPDVVRAFLAVSLGRLWPVVGFGALMAAVPFLPPVAWRLSRLGSRTASGFAATSATAALIFAGVAGPTAGAVYGPAKNQQVSQIATQASPPQPPVQSPPATSPAATPPAPGGGSAPAGSSTTTPTPGQPPSGSSSGPAKAVYPAGIARHPNLPAGIAKKPNPFAQWRAHH